MVEDLDFHDLLQTGHWTTSGARGSGRSGSPGRRALAPHLDPFRTPRFFNREDFLRCRRYPPSPSVEDEAEAIRREHGSSLTVWPDEEPKCPGHADQLPVILPSPEANPERRFVLVTPSETSDEGAGEDQPAADEEEPLPAPPSFKPGYEANVGRKYDPVEHDQGSAKRAPAARRKSRIDLPRIETDLLPNARSLRTDKAKSATYVDQRPRDYFDYHQASTRPASQEPLLSPVIKHTTKGRDRAYWDFNAGAQVTAPRKRSSYHETRSPADERRISDSGFLQPPSASTPTVHRRSASAVGAPPPGFRRSAGQFGSYREEIASSRPRRRDPSPSPAHRRPLSSPPPLNRTGSSPVRESSGRGVSSRRNSAHQSHRSRHDGDFDSSDEGEYHPRRDRRKSVVTQDHNSFLLSPDYAHAPPSGSRRASRSTTPLASPRSSQGHFPMADPSPGPRASQTFPPSPGARRRRERAVSPFSSEDSSPPRNGSRPRAGDKTPGARSRSRAASLRSSASAGRPAALPLPIPAQGAASPVEGRRSPAPPSPSSSRHSSLEGSPPRAVWRPGSFGPSAPAREADAAQPVASYRRHSEDVSLGRLPGFPRCPRQAPGRDDGGGWLTLPRCDGFSICPSCYGQVFAGTAFRQHFVPAAARPAHRPAACDFGASPWYRIAWLMTCKYRYPDLRLLHGVAAAAAAARLDPCPGAQAVRRQWYSIRDPASGRGIPGFSTCHQCARSVEALFPDLTGVFVPLAPPREPRRDVCALRPAPGRNRFAQYFDLLEAAHDRALRARSAPDVGRLAGRVRALARLGECRRDAPARDAVWFVMEGLPDMVACPECYHDAVRPEGLDAAEGFRFEPARLPDAACRLYSDRMREALRAAARRGDPGLLAARLEARRAAEIDTKTELARIKRAGGMDDQEKRAQMEKVVEMWRALE